MAHIDIFEGASDAEVGHWLAERLAAALTSGAEPVAITSLS